MGGFVLHIPWYALPAMETTRLITSRGAGYRTVSGVPVVVGSGYSGVLPDLDHTGTAKADAPDELLPEQGQIAFYTTRSVPEYRLGSVNSYADLAPAQATVGGQTAQAGMGQELTNQLTAESWRTAALRFDPGCVYSVAVNLDQGVC
jgi:hypothetical protein